MLCLSGGLSQVSSAEHPVSLFHCPVAKGCAAGSFSLIKEFSAVFSDRVLQSLEVVKD